MKRLLLGMTLLTSLQAESVQEILENSPRLDAPGPGYRGERGLFVPLESISAARVPISPPARPSINPWTESYLAPQVSPPANPAIDYPAFEWTVGEVGRLREKRRLTEEEFLRKAAEPGTIILDARSREKFEGLHIKGAVNLSLPDITAEELARIIPSKDTCVLIYCNNNFEDASADSPAKAKGVDYGAKGFVVFRKGGDGARLLPRKSESAALNLYTFNTLFAYGYTNVYELGPLIEIQDSKLPFEGSSVVPQE
jgi:phage shock protein E